MENAFPKVLVISHTPFAKENSMGSTLASYFTHYPPQNVAQLYIKEMQPNIPVCYSFYKVTDGELFSKLRHPFKTTVGSPIKLDENHSATTGVSSAKPHNLSGQKHRHLALLLRNVLWGTKLWDTAQFRSWVADFAPDVILVQPGDFAYIIKMATDLSLSLDIPLVVHQSEAYYIKPFKSKSLFYRIYRHNFKKNYDRMMRRASDCVYLCEALERDYKKHFPDVGLTIMKATPTPVSDNGYTFNKNEPRFIYAGNLGAAVGRCEPLVQLGKAVKRLGYSIDVYTATKGDHMSELTEENGIILHDAVPYDELTRKIAASDFVVHIENQSRAHVEDLRYAFSTKISDMLSSARCAIIYGSAEIAGIKYFKEYSLGCVIERESDLTDKIKQLIENDELREGYIQNALFRATEYHNSDKNAEMMNDVIKNAFCKASRNSN